jgi:hypothetical protein
LPKGSVLKGLMVEYFALKIHSGGQPLFVQGGAAISGISEIFDLTALYNDYF